VVAIAWSSQKSANLYRDNKKNYKPFDILLQFIVLGGTHCYAQDNAEESSVSQVRLAMAMYRTHQLKL